ncbi:hypothetical protein F2P56_036165 [Juglans regia]|uniref:Protein kinase domain-containing protein n=2 Tax=Juglans regia TaxID=51240 RepID=A0A833TY67_JUGRE|nr:inactive leucine-rich repeat receptor-like protein kinase CORYNE [Juglans regia]KAF5443624.1 hypothetical protein F2P56_036165 [Juglans regia]
MEKRGKYTPSFNNDRFFPLLLLLVSFCFHHAAAYCREKTTKHISSQPPPPKFQNGLRNILLSIALGALTGFLGALLFALIVRSVIRYLNRTPLLKCPVIFSPKITPMTLQAALANENHLLGSSSNGKYYRTVLDNGLVIAVKRLEQFPTGSPEKCVKRMIQQELEMLASLRHQNLMSLRAYVRESSGGLSLLYDYVPTGSLEDAMHRVRDNQLRLGWELRLRIAVGVVKGLQYLHFDCESHFLHYNLKPTNVMLDADFEPRLADCGLAKLMPSLDGVTSGYSAPECFQNCRYTDKSDVFSFGMILGVLLTGRDPTDPFFGEPASGGSLGQWLRHLQQAGEAREVLDTSILGEEVEEDEMLMAMRIAVECLSDIPADRPSSDELVHMLTQLHSF